MSTIQVVRTVGLGLILMGLALGLLPVGQGGCGSGWLAPAGYGGGCGGVMAPVGSWAIGLVVIGAVMHVGAWINTPYIPKSRRSSASAQQPKK